MNHWPAVVLLGGVCLAVPAAYWFGFRRRGPLARVRARYWFIAGAVAFALFPALLFRKHYEAALVYAKNTFWFVAGVVQMDNNLWEELGKLLAMLAFLALAGASARAVFRTRHGGSAWGYWTGLCYGIGEAVTLTFIGWFPQLGRAFGVSLFLYFTTWGAVLERAYAVQVHAIMGALVGLGLYHWAGLRKRWWLAFFFALAVLYHELVDGTILVMMYYPRLAFSRFAAGHLMTVVLPALVAAGYLLLLVAYRSSRVAPDPRRTLPLATSLGLPEEEL